MCINRRADMLKIKGGPQLDKPKKSKDLSWINLSSMTRCCPLSYGPRAAPSKEDGGTLERGTDACLAPVQDDVVTLK
jgi:hypothetical protein